MLFGFENCDKSHAFLLERLIDNIYTAQCGGTLRVSREEQLIGYMKNTVHAATFKEQN